MGMNFSSVAVATSIAGLILGLGWLFAGRLWLRRLGLQVHASGLIVGRRLGAVYLGIALLLFLLRSAPESDLRSSICMAMVFALALLALLGLIEFKAGRAGRGILISVALELLLVAGFFSALLT
jgi:hypothetical protein